MNDNSTSQSKALVVAYTREDVINCVPVIRELANEGTATTVLGLDFGSWAELRRRNICFETPATYFDTSRCAEIDTEAIALARGWYQSIAHRTTYHGISLGEMVEYNFAHLFIDALRAIEIAHCLIEREEPNKILLPANVPLFPHNAVRYETLPDAILWLAKSNGIHVSFVPANPRASPTRTKIADKAASYIKRHPTLYQAASYILCLRDLGVYRDIRRLRSIGKIIRNRELERTIVFLDVPNEVFLPIKRDLQARRLGNLMSISEYTIANARKWPGRELASMIASWRSLEELDELAKTLVYADVPVGEILARRFARFLSDECPYLARCIEGAENFIRDAKPSIVVVFEDITPIHRAIIKVCKTRGIPTLVIQHGMLGTDMRGFHVMPVEADRQAVWGTPSKEWAIKRGKPRESQVITGNPRFDLIATARSNYHTRRITVCRELGLDSGAGIVMIASSYYQASNSCYTPEDVEAFLADTLTAMKRFPEKSIVVKLHPAYAREFEAITRSLIEQLQVAKAIVTERFLWELLDMCDLVVTEASTVGLEGILFDKPVIIFNPPSARDASLNPYMGTDSVINVYKAEDLVPAIKDALYDSQMRTRLTKARKEFVRQYVYSQDGRASQRVAHLIGQMALRPGR